MNRRICTIIVVGSAVLCATRAFADQPRFTPLGQYPAGRWSMPLDLTPDGSIVVGAAVNGNGNWEAFKWTEAEGLVGLGFLNPDVMFPRSIAAAITPDGRLIAGSSAYGDWLGDLEAIIWNPDGTMTELGFTNEPGIDQASQAGDLSDDGGVIVGIDGDAASRCVAFRWTEATGMISLGDLPGGYTVGRAHGVSADGSVIAGSGAVAMYDREAFRWTESEGMVALGRLPGYQESDAQDISDDGRCIVGYCENEGTAEAFRWNAEEGMIGLGVGASWNSSRAYQTNADGRLIAGSLDEEEVDYEAFIWSKPAGVRGLMEALATDAGMDLQGWYLQEVNGLSPDGRFMIGVGLNPQEEREGWLIDLGDPIPCIGDLTGDRQRNIADLAALLASYGVDAGGDLDDDGDTDVSDLAAMLSRYNQPCTW